MSHTVTPPCVPLSLAVADTSVPHPFPVAPTACSLQLHPHTPVLFFSIRKGPDLYFLCVFLIVSEMTELISCYSFYLASALGCSADVPLC